MVFKHFYAPNDLNKKDTLCSFCKESLYKSKCLISYANTKYKLTNRPINIHLAGLCSSCIDITNITNNCELYKSYIKNNFDELSYVFNFQKEKCIMIPNSNNEAILCFKNDCEKILIGFIQPIQYCGIDLYKIHKYEFISVQDFLYHYGYIDPWNVSKIPKGYVQLSKVKHNIEKCCICGIKQNIKQYESIHLCISKICYFKSINYRNHEMYTQKQIPIKEI